MAPLLSWSPGTWSTGDLSGYAYAAADVSVAVDRAADRANLVAFDGSVTKGYVYEVEPVDADGLEPDGEYDEGIAYRTTASFGVVRLVKEIP